MSTETTNLGLTLPESSEGYDVAIVNANNEAIDAAVGSLQTQVGTTLSGKVDAIQTDVTDIKTKATATNTTVGTINTNLTAASGNVDSIKTVADSNATKLNNLKTVTDATKTAADTINTNTASTKATAETINSKIGANTDTETSTVMGKLNDIAPKVEIMRGRIGASTDTADTSIMGKLNALPQKATVDTINSNTASTKTTAEAINTTLGTVNTNTASAKSTAETINGKVGASSDTGNTSVFGLLNQLKTSVASLTTALATANANITTLLTQSKGVKAIASGVTRSDGNETATASIPSTMDPAKVVILANVFVGTSVYDSGVYWTISGRTVTFKTKNNADLCYQFIEFY